MLNYIYYGTIGFMSGGILGFFGAKTQSIPNSIYDLKLKNIINVWSICGASIGVLYVLNDKKPLLYKYNSY